MTKYLEIAVNVPQVSGVFHYHLPPELEGVVKTGQLLLVPFGRQTVQGVALNFVDQPEVAETRAVIEVVDPDVALTSQQIALAQAMSRDWLAPLAACIGVMLPPGVEQQADLIYKAKGRPSEDLTKAQERLMKLLYQRGPLRGQQIDRALPRMNWRSSVRTLIRRGLVDSEAAAPEVKVHPKFVRTVRLTKPLEVVDGRLPALGKAGTEAERRRTAMVQFLVEEGGEAEAAWLYAASGGNLSDLHALEKRGIVTFGEVETWRDPLVHSNYPLYEAPPLTKDQQTVWDEVVQKISAGGHGEGAVILLHGVTGSGKTEIYLRAVSETLSQGRQAIVLVPEIALTPQTIQRFAGRFPGQVGLAHSGLSQGERYDTWRRARKGELNLVVGPRSALFTPFSRLGLIVVDECHDDSFYQSEGAPYYHAREVAAAYARIAGAVCLMGSATPDVTSVFKVERGEWLRLRLPERILAHRSAVQAQLERIQSIRSDGSAGRSHYRELEGQAETIELPPVQIIDMREELKGGNRSIFSGALQKGIGDVLDRGEQVILFLNRRGTATYVFCRDCGYTMRCPRCETPLTYHEIDQALVCHYCGYRRRMPRTCPNCGSERIRQYGTGTQKVESDLKEIFPQARTLRWDHETTRRKGAHEAILRQFATQQANVLIGTQMLAKGMDLPLVTLVGVVLADVGLNLPDYRANERTFQVLTQVAGRAGRSPLGGEVILQTFQPEHYVIQTASGHNFQSFYDHELAFRRQQGYPPFGQLVRLEYRHLDPEKAEHAAQELAVKVRQWMAEGARRATRMIGPAPCFFGRISGYYRWQIVLCGPEPASMLRGQSIADWKVELNPPSLL